MHCSVTTCGLRLEIWSGRRKSPGFLPAFLGRSYDILQSKHCGRSSSYAECNDGCRPNFRVVVEVVVQHRKRPLEASCSKGDLEAGPGENLEVVGMDAKRGSSSSPGADMEPRCAIYGLLIFAGYLL